jgi:alpha-beta hydrolase superfamily lysophospholipase
VRIADLGAVASAPFYQPMFDALQAAGYTLDRNVRVAGYDARLTPDLGGFLERTKRLVEDTYRDNGNRPVHLVGHSNGPLYAQYLLTHTSEAWKEKYIHRGRAACPATRPTSPRRAGAHLPRPRPRTHPRRAPDHRPPARRESALPTTARAAERAARKRRA